MGVVAEPYHIVPATTKAAKKDSSNTTGKDGFNIAHT
jgi:hypothetical protein